MQMHEKSRTGCLSDPSESENGATGGCEPPDIGEGTDAGSPAAV